MTLITFTNGSASVYLYKWVRVCSSRYASAVAQGRIAARNEKCKTCQRGKCDKKWLQFQANIQLHVPYIIELIFLALTDSDRATDLCSSSVFYSLTMKRGFFTPEYVLRASTSSHAIHLCKSPDSRTFGCLNLHETAALKPAKRSLSTEPWQRKKRKERIDP